MQTKVKKVLLLFLLGDKEYPPIVMVDDIKKEITTSLKCCIIENTKKFNLLLKMPLAYGRKHFMNLRERHKCTLVLLLI